MKKVKLLILVPVAIAGLSAVSCKKNKCAECHYDKNGAEVELGEKCGDDLESLESSGYMVNDTLYEVHCHEH
jgi:hypothetical protein